MNPDGDDWRGNSVALRTAARRFSCATAVSFQPNRASCGIAGRQTPVAEHEALAAPVSESDPVGSSDSRILYAAVAQTLG